MDAFANGNREINPERTRSRSLRGSVNGSDTRQTPSVDMEISSIDISEGSRDAMDENMRATAKELRLLSFTNPGPSFMTNFDPERSSREMRKVNRRIYKENVRKNQLYNDDGQLLADKRDLCDCLEPSCPGCHFPCQRCGSEKCGHECRCNRKWYYMDVEIEGTNKKVTFPNPPQAKNA